MRNLIRRRLTASWTGFTLAILSIVYGIQLYLHPSILQMYRVYNLIESFVDHHTLGLIFIFLGALKLFGILFKNTLIKRISLIGLSVVWIMYGVAFAMSPPPNTIWIFSFGIVMLTHGVNNRIR